MYISENKCFNKKTAIQEAVLYKLNIHTEPPGPAIPSNYFLIDKKTKTHTSAVSIW